MKIRSSLAGTSLVVSLRSLINDSPSMITLPIIFIKDALYPLSYGSLPFVQWHDGSRTHPALYDEMGCAIVFGEWSICSETSNNGAYKGDVAGRLRWLSHT
jgi:hypothetical protein